jgi:hypothetical protein
MCLINIKKFEGNDIVRMGWKVFYKRKYIRPFSFLYSNRKIVMGEWMESEIEPGNYVEKSEKYTKGFHIFTNHKEAKEYTKRYNSILKKVFYKNTTYTGNEEITGFKTVVADSLLIPIK